MYYFKATPVLKQGGYVSVDEETLEIRYVKDFISDTKLFRKESAAISFIRSVGPIALQDDWELVFFSLDISSPTQAASDLVEALVSPYTVVYKDRV